MKFELYLENESGDVICFTQSSRAFMVTEVTGLDEPTATITTSGYSTMDGSQISNAVIPQRNITISFRITGSSVEASRQLLYSTVKVRKPIKVRYKTATTDVWTQGYVETCSVSNFTSETSGQISVICGNPYWFETKKNDITIQQIEDTFKLPISIPEYGVTFREVGTNETVITNNGEDTGYIITFDVKSSKVYQREFILRIDNTDTDEHMEVTVPKIYGIPNFKVVISTRAEEKYIQYIGVDGSVWNAINWISDDSSWIICNSGKNTLKVSFTDTSASDFDTVSTNVLWQTSYLGV